MMDHKGGRHLHEREKQKKYEGKLIHSCAKVVATDNSRDAQLFKDCKNPFKEDSK